MTVCECGTELVPSTGKGRPPTFCSNACKQRAYRARKSNPIPALMTERHSWARHITKRPVTPGGSPASSTDASTWSSFTDVQSGAGNGFGIMLGSGLGCYDFDHCLDGDALSPRIERAVSAIPERVVWVERSLGGDGLHVFVEAPEQKGYRRNGIEFYSRERFIAVTADRFNL